MVNEISISGRLLMLDGVTPHVACVVQTVKPATGGNERVAVATTLSDEGGSYQFVNLAPGRYQVRCYTSNGYVYYLVVKSYSLSTAKHFHTSISVCPIQEGNMEELRRPRRAGRRLGHCHM